MTTIRIGYDPNICVAPQYIAEELLRAEGFTDIRYVHVDQAGRRRSRAARSTSISKSAALARLAPGCRRADHRAGRCARRLLRAVRARADPHHQRPAAARASASRGWARARTCCCRSWRRTSGSTRTRTSTGSPTPISTSWSCSPTARSTPFSAFRPKPQELRARKIGRVILNTATDRPWSQYFCCLLFGNREFVRDHPVATKRCLRAILKAADICADRAGDGPRNGWSMAGSRSATTTRSRR